MADIKILPSQEIDKVKWDSLVLESSDGSLFCTYDYLSYCEGQWEALIVEDEGEYLHAIPIPFRLKWGIKYIYQSPLQCYLTVLSQSKKNKFDQEFIKDGMKELRAYPYVAKYFFRGNFFGNLKDYASTEIQGLQINLQREYDEIYSCYSKFRKRMLKKAKRRDQQIVKSADLESFILLHEEFTLPKIKSLHYEQQEVMRNLWKKLFGNNQLEIYFAVSASAIVGGILIGKYGNFLHALASFNTDEGRKMKSNTLLKDHIIKLYAMSGYSSLELGRMAVSGIDDFKLSFGATRYSIWQLYRNSLPFYVKFPKKILNFFGIEVQ